MIPSMWQPRFQAGLAFPNIYNRSKFEYCALSGLKVESLGRKSKKKEKKQEKKNRIQVGVNEENQKKGSL